MPESLLWLATLVFTGFAFAYGACFGSFLNVVLYRLPRGLSLTWTRSQCPACQSPIASRDNLPILSWLRLGGRCRACGAPIPPSYLLVELGVACLFAGLFLLIPVAHGQTLPEGWNAHRFANWVAELPSGRLFPIYLHQCLIGFSLLTVCLMDQRGLTAPWLLGGLAGFVHLLLVLWNPAINQLDRTPQGPLAWPAQSLAASWNYSLSGLLLALIVTGLLWAGGAILSACHTTTNSPASTSSTSTSPQRQGSWLRNPLLSLLILGVGLGPIILAWSVLMAGSAQAVQALGTLRKTDLGSKPLGWPLHLFCAWLLIVCTWRSWPRIPWPPLGG